jgi:hypothetical protein
MSIDLAYPAPNPSPETAVRISQQAPQYLKSSSFSLPWPLSLLQGDLTSEQWSEYETLYMQCLRTGDNKSAREILDKLVDRFGDNNERIMAFQGMWEEAMAENEKDLINVLKIYGEILGKDPTIIVSLEEFLG